MSRYESSCLLLQRWFVPRELLRDLRAAAAASRHAATPSPSAPPPPALGGFAALVGGVAVAACATTEPATGTSEVAVVVVTPIDAVRVKDVPACGSKVTLIEQLPLFGCRVAPGQVDAVMRKSAASPPLAIVIALFVTKTRSPVPVFVIVTVDDAVAPTDVAGKIGPLAGA
jgi:hypothetical protein